MPRFGCGSARGSPPSFFSTTPTAVLYGSVMTKHELNTTILSAVGESPDTMRAVVERVAKASTVDRSAARDAIETLLGGGRLRLDLNMHLEAVK